MSYLSCCPEICNVTAESPFLKELSAARVLTNFAGEREASFCELKRRKKNRMMQYYFNLCFYLPAAWSQAPQNN